MSRFGLLIAFVYLFLNTPQATYGQVSEQDRDRLIEAIESQVRRWQERGDWSKLMCIELLTVRGLPNKKAAEMLELSEQQVANFKFDFISRLRTLIKKQGLAQEVFPELYEE